MRTTWPIKRLGELALVERGTVVTRADVSVGDVPVIAGGLEPAYYHNVANRPAGAITISASGANSGHVSRWDTPIFASDCTTVVSDGLVVAQDFVFYFLKSQQSYIQRDLRRGAAQPHVYAKDLARLEIPVPPLAEQQRIVAKLGSLLPEVEYGLSLVAQMKAKSDGLVLSSLTGMFQRLTSSPSKSYGEVAELSLGKMLDRKKATGRHPTPYLRNVNVRWGTFETSDVMEMDITPSELDRVSVRQGDVVVCEGGEPGRCAVWREGSPMAIQKALHRMRPNPGMDSDYLALNLEYQIKCGTAKDLFTGTTIKHLTGEKLQVMTLPVPPLREQQEAVEQLRVVRKGADALRSVADARRRTLVAMRQSVLAAAFRGEL